VGGGAQLYERREGEGFGVGGAAQGGGRQEVEQEQANPQQGKRQQPWQLKGCKKSRNGEGSMASRLVTFGRKKEQLQRLVSTCMQLPT
jgi:hypothetical protein